MRSTPTTDDGTDATTEETERRLRLRTLFWEYRTVIVAAAFVLLLLGGWLSYGVFADPGEATEQRLEHQWTTTGELHHEATVTESTELHAEGTVLENEPLYYTSITPVFDGEFVAGYDADRGEGVRVAVDVELVYRAVDSEDATVYWRQNETLASTNATEVAPGEPVAAPFTVNVSEIGAAIEGIEADLGASPGETEIELEIERTVEGDIDGEFRQTSDVVAVPIEYADATYHVDDEQDYDRQHEAHETVTVPASYGPTRSIGGPLLLLVGLGGIAVAAVASRRLPEPTRRERTWLDYREERDEFTDLITTAKLPDSTFERERATVASLEDLATIGIDVGEAVVFDRRRDQYVVSHDGTTYVFDPPTLEADENESEVGGSTTEDGTESRETDANEPPEPGTTETVFAAATSGDGPGEDATAEAAVTETSDEPSPEPSSNDGEPPNESGASADPAEPNDSRSASQ